MVKNIIGMRDLSREDIDGLISLGLQFKKEKGVFLLRIRRWLLCFLRIQRGLV